jgi:hypothetical protein
MQIIQMSNHYLDEDVVTDEVQKGIDDAINGKNKNKIYQNADQLFEDLNISQHE